MRHEREAAEHVGNNVDNGTAMLAKVLAVHLTRHQERSGQIRLNHCIPTLTKREVALKLFYWVRTFSEIATDFYPETYQPQDKETVPCHYSPERLFILPLENYQQQDKETVHPHYSPERLSILP